LDFEREFQKFNELSAARASRQDTAQTGDASEGTSGAP
jgi:hypothetical protein